MRARVVSVCNMKGGVGKTTSTIIMAEGLSSRVNEMTGHLNRVLVIDTDPQSNLSFSYLGYENLVHATAAKTNINSAMVKALIHGKPAGTSSMIVSGVSHLTVGFEGRKIKSPISILASGYDLIDVERRIIAGLTRDGRSYREIIDDIRTFFTRDVLEHARENYDWVIVDCQPGFGLLTQAAISSADATVVVTVPEPLAEFGLRLFVTANKVPFESFPIPPDPLILLSRVTKGQTTHAKICARIREEEAKHGYHVLRTVVPEAASFKKNEFFETVVMSMKGKYGANVGLVKELAAELEERVNGQG